MKPLQQQSPAVQIYRPDQLEGVSLVQISPSSERWSGYQKTWDVCLLTAGVADWRYRGATHTTAAGAIRLKEPGEQFKTTRVSAPAGYMIVQVDPTRFEALRQELSGVRGGLAVVQMDTNAHTAQLKSLFHRLASAQTTLERSECVVALVRRALLSSLEKTTGQKGEHVCWQSVGMRQARDFLYAHYREEIPLAVLANIAGVHEVYLACAFRQIYGLPPHQLQIELRIRAAQRLLDQGLQGSEVAARVGFFDQSHLTRHFKRIFGVTPGSYVRSRRPSGVPLVAELSAYPFNVQLQTMQG